MNQIKNGNSLDKYDTFVRTIIQELQLRVDEITLSNVQLIILLNIAKDIVQETYSFSLVNPKITPLPIFQQLVNQFL